MYRKMCYYYRRLSENVQFYVNFLRYHGNHRAKVRSSRSQGPHRCASSLDSDDAWVRDGEACRGTASVRRDDVIIVAGQKLMMNDATIDPREVDFYKGLASFWWDDTGPFWPLHRLNRLRVQWIVDALTAHFQLDSKAAEPLSGLRILDIGCGGGILAESMARLGAEVTGIDVVDKNIRIAELHASQQELQIDYRACTAEAMAREGSAYDVVLNMEVVEHVADLSAFMIDCNRLVADGGVAFVATINRTARSWLFAKIGAEYILRWLPKGTHRWREFRSPETVAGLLQRGGLQVCRRSGVAVNPLNRSFRLTRNMSVNYMMMARRPPATSPRGRASGQAA